jgi:hypothetical protein
LLLLVLKICGSFDIADYQLLLCYYIYSPT